MVDKNFCMSSYLAFRYIEADGIEFKEGLRHENFKPLPDSEKTVCFTADDIDKSIEKQFGDLKIRAAKWV